MPTVEVTGGCFCCHYDDLEARLEELERTAMPHAIFVETDVDGNGLVAAYAAELPGCAVFASTDTEATAAMPSRVGTGHSKNKS